MNEQPSEQRFLKDVAQHQMTILREDGVHRHIRYSAPGTMCMHFDLITWPGCLCYTGDMGTYVFTRLADMFQFFRSKPENAAGLYINLGYWSEKCVAADRDGVKGYSEDRFEEYVREHTPDDATSDLVEAIDDEVLSAADEGNDSAHRALRDFRYDNKEVFLDTFEADFTDYTYRFVWCCYALAWGIRTYDARIVPPPAPAPPALREVHEAAV